MLTPLAINFVPNDDREERCKDKNGHIRPFSQSLSKLDIKKLVKLVRQGGSWLKTRLAATDEECAVRVRGVHQWLNIDDMPGHFTMDEVVRRVVRDARDTRKKMSENPSAGSRIYVCPERKVGARRFRLAHGSDEEVMVNEPFDSEHEPDGWLWLAIWIWNQPRPQVCRHA